jgi:hypothetical protein
VGNQGLHIGHDEGLNAMWKIVQVVYIVGYWLYVLGAAIFYWPLSTGFFDWQTYVFFQLLYALVWPILFIAQVV